MDRADFMYLPMLLAVSRSEQPIGPREVSKFLHDHFVSLGSKNGVRTALEAMVRRGLLAKSRAPRRGRAGDDRERWVYQLAPGIKGKLERMLKVLDSMRGETR